MRKGTKGFTIVELLIVIVVIGVLAAITIVAYNGIQTRAKNTQSINATAAWIKAIKLYTAEKGVWPSANSCFGTTTTYQSTSGQCWNGTGWTVSSTFMSQVQPYLSGTPEPDTTDIATTNSPRRGAFYQLSGNDRFVWVSFVGISTCPDMGSPLSTSGIESNGIYCRYTIGSV